MCAGSPEERIATRVLIEDPRHPALRHVRAGSYIKGGKIYIRISDG